MNQNSFYNFHVTNIIFACVALKDFSIGPFWGDVLHSALGKSLRKKYCITKNRTCNDCPELEYCAYRHIFMYTPPRDMPNYRKYSDPPQPIIIRKESYEEVKIKKGNKFPFEINFVGKGSDSISAVVRALIKAGQYGFGHKNQIQFEVDELRQYADQSKTSTLLYNADKPCVIKFANDATVTNQSKISLDFCTPYYLLEKGVAVSKPESILFLQRLYERISLLSFLYCNGDEPNIFPVDEDKLSFSYDVKPVPITRKKRMTNPYKISGNIGTITLQGDISKYMQLIEIGQWVNVGKMSGLGLGAYRLKV